MALAPGDSVLVTDWTLAALSLVFVGGRCYVRIFKLRLPLSLSDYLVIFGWLDIVAAAALDTRVYLTDGFNSHNNRTNQIAGIDAEETAIKLQKTIYAATFFYDVGLYLPKFSFLAFYNQWISHAFPKLRIAFYILTAYVCAAFAVVFILALTWCRPISSNWSLDPAACHNVQDINFSIIVWALNISSDIFIFMLPFFLLPYLKLQRSSYYSAMVVFLLGLLTIASTTTKFASLLTSPNVPLIFILYSVELNISIIVTCLPTLKNALFSAWNSLFSSPGRKESYLSASTDLEATAQEISLPRMDNIETTDRGKTQRKDSHLTAPPIHGQEKAESAEEHEIATELRDSEDTEGPEDSIQREAEHAEKVA